MDKAIITCDFMKGDFIGLCETCANIKDINKCKEGNPEGNQITVYETKVKKCDNYIKK